MNKLGEVIIKFDTALVDSNKGILLAQLDKSVLKVTIDISKET